MPIAAGRVVIAPPVRPISVSGTDYIEAASLSEKTIAGTVLAQVDLSPGSWGGTHASEVALLYEKFRFRNLRINVSSRCPTTVAGGYLIGYDSDPERLPSHNVKRYVRALPGSASVPLWMSRATNFPPSSDWRYTRTPPGEDAQPRFTSFGTFYLVCDEPPTTTTGTFYLTIEVQYTIEFIKPIIDEPDDDVGGVLSFPAGKKGVTDDGLAIYSDGGGKSTVDWSSQFSALPYDSIMQLHPSISLSNSALFGDQPATLAYARNGTFGDSKGFVFYTTYELALEAGSNPSRDASKNVKFVGDAIAFPAFKAAYYK